MSFLVQLLVSLVLMVAAYLIMPKPKTGSSTDAGSLDDPKASAGSPIKKVFGTLTVKDPNVLWYGDKSTRNFQKDG